MKDVAKQFTDTALDVTDEVQEVITRTEKTIETTISPVSKSIVKRYPTAFLLAVTFGASLTFFGIEQLLQSSVWFSGHPVVSIIVGMVFLAITGTVYKKLG